MTAHWTTTPHGAIPCPCPPPQPVPDDAGRAATVVAALKAWLFFRRVHYVLRNGGVR